MRRLNAACRKRAKAIRNVRRRLLARLDDSWGAWESMRPIFIAQALAGSADWLRPGLVENIDAIEYFEAIGVSAIQQWKNSVAELRTTGRRRKERQVPVHLLRRAFGREWRVVHDAWPALPTLNAVLEARLAPNANDSEAALWEEGRVRLLMRGCNLVFLEEIKKLVPNLVRRAKVKSPPGMTVDEAVEEASSKLQLSLLESAKDVPASAHLVPGGGLQKARRAMFGWLVNRVRDGDKEKRVLGYLTDALTGEQLPIERSRSTLRRWRSEEKRGRRVDGSPAEQALARDRLRQNRDPTGKLSTISEIARQLQREDSTVRLAVRRAVDAGELEPKRLPKGRSYGFTVKDRAIIKKHLGPQRKRRRRKQRRQPSR